MQVQICMYTTNDVSFDFDEFVFNQSTSLIIPRVM